MVLERRRSVGRNSNATRQRPSPTEGMGYVCANAGRAGSWPHASFVCDWLTFPLDIDFRLNIKANNKGQQEQNNNKTHLWKPCGTFEKEKKADLQMRIPRTLPKLSLNGELCANGKCVFVFASALDISFDTVLGNVKSDWNMKNIKNFQNDQRCIQLAIQICGRQLSQQSNPWVSCLRAGFRRRAARGKLALETKK